MDNMENTSCKKSKSWIVLVVAIIVMLLTILGCYTCWIISDQNHAPGAIQDGILYLNYEETYVYSSLNCALNDTKGEDGPPKPLKEILPEILAEEKLVYLDGTTVGICIDKQITQKEIIYSKDKIVYQIDDYYLAKTISKND